MPSLGEMRYVRIYPPSHFFTALSRKKRGGGSKSNTQVITHTVWSDSQKGVWEWVWDNKNHPIVCVCVCVQLKVRYVVDSCKCTPFKVVEVYQYDALNCNLIRR